jgi:hypothetical protein
VLCGTQFPWWTPTSTISGTHPTILNELGLSAHRERATDGMIRGKKKLALAAIVFSGCTINYQLPPVPSQSVTPNQPVTPAYTASAPEPAAVIQPSEEDYTRAAENVKALNDD